MKRRSSRPTTTQQQDPQPLRIATDEDPQSLLEAVDVRVITVQLAVLITPECVARPSPTDRLAPHIQDTCSFLLVGQRHVAAATRSGQAFHESVEIVGSAPDCDIDPVHTRLAKRGVLNLRRDRVSDRVSKQCESPGNCGYGHGFITVSSLAKERAIRSSRTSKVSAYSSSGPPIGSGTP